MISFARSKEIIGTAVLDYLFVVLSWYLLYNYFSIQEEVFLYVWGVKPLTAGWILSGYWVFILSLFGLYKKMYLISRLDEFIRVAKATLLGTLVLFFLITTRQQSVLWDAQVSTLIYWGVTLSAIAFNRFIIRTVQRFYAIQGKGLHRALIIGCGNTAQTVHDDLLRHRILGMQVVGFIEVNENLSGDEIRVDKSKILGSLDEIEQIVKREHIQDIIVALEPEHRDDLLDVISEADIPDISLKILPDFYHLVNGLNKTNQIFGLPLIEISPETMPWWEKGLKRLMDIVVSLIVLIITSPLMAVIGLIVRSTSDGPAIYRQKRVGKNGRTFTMYKFRTMYKDAEAQSGPTWAQKNDPRITPIGNWLRKLRLDELPQFWNVLKGNMSLVGPRPERPYFVEQFKEQIPLYGRRLRVRPGITGWAQVKWKYDTSLQDVKEKTKFDLFYVENMSLIMDFKILINTIMTIIRAKGH